LGLKLLKLVSDEKLLKLCQSKGLRVLLAWGIISTWVSKSGGAAKVLQQEEEEELQ
jgi:hypothetical protein